MYADAIPKVASVPVAPSREAELLLKVASLEACLAESKQVTAAALAIGSAKTTEHDRLKQRIADLENLVSTSIICRPIGSQLAPDVASNCEKELFETFLVHSPLHMFLSVPCFKEMMDQNEMLKCASFSIAADSLPPWIVGKLSSTHFLLASQFFDKAVSFLPLGAISIHH